MSADEASLYFLGGDGDPIPYIGLVPIDPQSRPSSNFSNNVILIII